MVIKYLLNLLRFTRNQEADKSELKLKFILINEGQSFQLKKNHSRTFHKLYESKFLRVIFFLSTT